MRHAAIAFLLAVALTGCQDRGHTPRLALHKDDASQAVKIDDPSLPPHINKKVTTKVPADFHYQGRTLTEWALALSDPNQETIHTAAEALRIIGPPGRPYLFQGLEHPNPETRRLCLDNLSGSDLRVYGDHGRDLLVKLSGDPFDFRIRSRSTMILEHWQEYVPGRP